MDEVRVVRLVYTFFLGLLIAIFIGVGINTFYPGPKMPEYPIELNTYGKDLTTEQEARQREWDQKMQDHNDKSKPYSRNVSMMTLGAAVILLAISILYEKKLRFLADGVMLGGLFTLFYSLIRGFASEDSKYTFLVVSVGLAVVLLLGYQRFIKPHEATVTKPNKKS